MRRRVQQEATGFGVTAGIVFCVALAARALHLWQLRGSPLLQVHLGDAAGYHAWAQRIAGGDWLGSEVFYQAPLYPYLLSAIYALFGQAWAPRVFQALLGSLACVLLALAGRRLFSPRAGLVAGLGLAIYPTAIFFDGLIQKSALDNLLICLLIWLLSRSTEAENHRAWLWVGLGLGALVLTRENALVLLAPIGLWLAVDPRVETRRRVAPALLMLAGLALALAPVAIRNAAVGGGFHLTTSQSGPNFYIGNRAGASGLYEPLRYSRGHVDYERRDAIELAQEAAGRTLSPTEVSAYWRDRALADIYYRPLDWLRLMGRKVALVWNATEIEDTEDQASYAEHSLVLRLASALHFGVLAPLALVGIWLTRGRWRQLWLLHAMIVVYAGSVALFFVLSRYRFPLVPFLLLFAAAGLTGIRDLVLPARRRELVYCAASVVALALFCNWPLVHHGDARVTTEVNLARALQEENDLEGAIDHLRRALEIEPRHPIAHANLGDVLFRHGDFEQAIAHYREALAGAPGDARSRSNLGLALAATGDREGALEQYRKALEIEPRHPEALNNLAGELARRGRLDEALRHYGEALDARPDYVDAFVNRAAVLSGADRIPEAISDLESAAGLAPEDTEILQRQADLHARLGNLEGSAECYRRAAVIAPDDARVRFDLGRTLASLDHFDEALPHLRAAVRLEPSAAHLNALAFALTTQPRIGRHDAEEAVRYAEHAAALTEGRHPAVLSVLAAAQASIGDFDAAIATARRALLLAQQAQTDRLARSLAGQITRYEKGEAYATPAEGDN